MKTGILIVDHGSRNAESNRLVEGIAAAFAEMCADTYDIVEPAHMELTEPSIAQAFDRCVRRGARYVIVSPFFLGPGKHWTEDIPRLVAEAAARHPGIAYQLAAPLGCDELILRLIEKRIEQCSHCAAEAGRTGP